MIFEPGRWTCEMWWMWIYAGDLVSWKGVWRQDLKRALQTFFEDLSLKSVKSLKNSCTSERSMAFNWKASIRAWNLCFRTGTKFIGTFLPTCNGAFIISTKSLKLINFYRRHPLLGFFVALPQSLEANSNVSPLPDLFISFSKHSSINYHAWKGHSSHRCFHTLGRLVSTGNIWYILIRSNGISIQIFFYGCGFAAVLLPSSILFRRT